MALTAEQKAFFQEHGYLSYGRVLSDQELDALRQRSADIAEGRLTHLPPRFIQLEKPSVKTPTPVCPASIRYVR